MFSQMHPIYYSHINRHPHVSGNEKNTSSLRWGQLLHWLKYRLGPKRDSSVNTPDSTIWFLLFSISCNKLFFPLTTA